MEGKEETSRPLHFRKHVTHLLVKYCHLVVTVTVKSSVDGVGKNTSIPRCWCRSYLSPLLLFITIDWLRCQTTCDRPRCVQRRMFAQMEDFNVTDDLAVISITIYSSPRRLTDSSTTLRKQKNEVMLIFFFKLLYFHYYTYNWVRQNKTRQAEKWKTKTIWDHRHYPILILIIIISTASHHHIVFIIIHTGNYITKS